MNRVFDEEGASEKPFGFIIDYCGVLKSLGEALTTNDALADFDKDDLNRAVTSIADEARTLPEKHAALLDLFSGVSNAYDEEAYARALADDQLRDEFYRALSAFSRTLTVAVASRTFLEETPPARRSRWGTDEKRFLALRAHVRARYADAVDWSDYERRIRALLDQHVTAHEVTTVVEPLSLFDDAAIEAARVDKKRTVASIADEIAHRTLRVIEEKWDEDPVFYEKFSTLIRATIDDFRKGRLEEKAYLEKIRSQRHRVETREDDDDPTPAGICGKGNETAFWGISRRELRKAGFDQEDIAENIAVALTGIINRYRTVGWQNDRDVQNRMRNDIDDFFFDEIVGARALQVNAAVIDAIVDDILASARVRMADDGRTR